MDQRLFKVAITGDVVALNKLLEEDPLVLDRVSLASSSENPLHIAALAGKSNFAREIIRLMPSFAWEQNQHGFYPMHMASARGHIEVVRDLLKLGPDQCLVKDTGEITPLHWAAAKGRVDIIEELLSQCPKAIEEVTFRGETVLHLAVKYNQVEALKVLIEKLKGLENYVDLLNAKDKEGKTIFTVAAAAQQFQMIDLLKNQNQLDGQDIVVDLPRDDFPQLASPDNRKSLVFSEPKQDQDQKKKQDHKNMRYYLGKAMPIVASVIVAGNYQAGLSPPPTIWKEGMNLNLRCVSQLPPFTTPGFRAKLCPAVNFYMFMMLNSFSLAASTLLILLYQVECIAEVLLCLALESMMLSYVLSLWNTLPNTVFMIIISLIVLSPVAYTLYLYISLFRKRRAIGRGCWK